MGEELQFNLNSEKEPTIGQRLAHVGRHVVQERCCLRPRVRVSVRTDCECDGRVREQRKDARSVGTPEDQPQLLRAILLELLEERVRSSRGRTVPRGVKRKMSSYTLRPRRYRRRPLSDLPAEARARPVPSRGATPPP